MKGDFTRSTFDRANHYSGVRQQQGRVTLDADWNEQIDLTRERIETEAADLIGPVGAPLHADGFHVIPTESDLSAEEAARPGNANPPALLGDGDFLITAGRIYIDGVRAENDAIATYRDQPYRPDPGPVAAGTYVAYLDVWDRHRTALEAPGIREVALGGPDTTTRTQTVWQVRLVDVSADAGDDASCATPFAAYDEATRPPTGQMGARAEESAASDDPCVVATGGGYRALENRLYRVEVHQGGPRAGASFKWSRDNGTVVARWLGETPVDATQMRIAVSTLGRDDVLRFQPGRWVELTDDRHELEGRPGTIVQVLRAEDDTLTLDLTSALGAETTLAAYPENPRVRRWDGVVQLVTNTNWQTLEDGVQVRFYNGTYRTGDYWLIPARTATSDIEWPQDGANPARLSPHGVTHHYARLALLTFDDSAWSDVSDCRPLFPPVTELTSLFYVSGEGQEATPSGVGGVALDHPLQVGVANGRWPVAGARVRFRMTQGGGQVNGAAETIVTTGANGVAGVGWTLGGENQPQQVEATLLDAGGAAIHLPIRFTARYRVGSGGAEPGFHVLRIEAGGAPMLNDAEVSAERLARGIEVTCDVPLIDEWAFGRRKPVCFVTLYLPWPFLGEERAFWNVNEPVATHPIRLDAMAAADDDAIFWTASPNIASWLRQSLFNILEEFGYFQPILGYLTLKGNFIWERDRENEAQGPYLDGDVFGTLRRDGGTDAILASGDTRRGGDLEIWFHLVRSEGEPTIRLQPPDLNFGVVTVGGAADETVVVGNGGSGPLIVTGFSVDDEAFTVLEPVPFTVEPGATRPVVVRWQPRQAGGVRTSLFVDSNDRHATARNSVGLFGEAQRETVPRNRARVQLIHNAFRVAPISLFFDEEQVVQNLELGSGTPFFDTRAGRRVTVRAINAETGGQIDTMELALVNGERYILVLCSTGDLAALATLPNAREEAAEAARVEFRPFNGLNGATSTMALREAGGTFALARCTGADGYVSVVPQGLNVVTVDAGGQRTGDFDFDLTAQAGQAFTLLGISFPVSDREVAVVYCIDGQGRRLMPRQTPVDRPVLVVGDRVTTRVGVVRAETQAETTTVPGIGAAFAERLAEAGVRNTGQLATLDAARVSAVLGISESRAANIVSEARTLVRRT